MVNYLLLSVLVFAGNLSAPNLNNYELPTELADLLNSKAPYFLSIGVLRTYKIPSETVCILGALWEGDENILKGKLSGNMLQNVDSIYLKIEFARVLLKDNNFNKCEFKLNTVNKTSLHSYIRKYASGQDIFYKSAAIYAIGLLADPTDIEILVSIANQREEQSFEQAIFALRMFNTYEAEEAILLLRKNIYSKKLIKILDRVAPSY